MLRNIVVVAAVGLVVGSAHAQSSGDPIRIGAILSITGGMAGLGIPERDGMNLARKLINERGGISGRLVDLVVEDDGSSPDVAMTKANTLLYTRPVRAIIGPSGLAQTVAVGGLTQSQKVPLIAFSGMGPPVEKERDCVFHITPAQTLNARSLLSYAREIKANKVGVLHDSGFGQLVWNVMKDMGGEFGISFSSVEKFEISATDLTAQAAKVKASGPDVVLVMSTSAVPFRNLRQVRLPVPVVSTHGTATYDYVKAMGDGADNLVHAEFLISEDPLPHQREFVELFRKEYGRLPKHFDAGGFDALMSLADAFAKAGPDAKGEPLCAAMRRPYQGAMTRYDFSAADFGGLTLASFTYSRLEKGQFKRLPFKAGEGN